MKKRPFITFKEALVSAGIVIFTAIAFGKIEITPTAPLRPVLDAEILQFSKQIKSLQISQIATKIEAEDGKPTLMVLYASWCGYCKMLLPSIAALKNEGRLNGIHLFMVSLDENKSNLSKYFLQHDYDKVFEPYMLENNDVMGLNNMLITKGTSYRGGIPYTVIFDSKGKILSIIGGLAKKEELLEEIEKVSNLPQSL